MNPPRLGVEIRSSEAGLYHIHAVDTVTQWEVVGCVQTISERHLAPVLEAMLHQFPFRILGFHCGNGSEFLNHRVAKLLNKLLAEFTKSRAYRTTDNALVEGKNGAVVRKHMGYGPIGAEHAEDFQKFYTAHFNSYLNYHRPCGFATVRILARGKRQRSYPAQGLPHAPRETGVAAQLAAVLEARHHRGVAPPSSQPDERHGGGQADAEDQAGVVGEISGRQVSAEGAVEMTGLWKAWKAKSRLSTLPTAPWKSRQGREISTFPQLRRRLLMPGPDQRQKATGRRESGKPTAGLPHSHRPDRDHPGGISIELRMGTFLNRLDRQLAAPFPGHSQNGYFYPELRWLVAGAGNRACPLWPIQHQERRTSPGTTPMFAAPDFRLISGLENAEASHRRSNAGARCSRCHGAPGWRLRGGPETSRKPGESHTHLLEMCVGGQHVLQAKFAHHHKAGEIGEGNARLIVKAQP